jgi:hypothetical protein
VRGQDAAFWDGHGLKVGRERSKRVGLQGRTGHI